MGIPEQLNGHIKTTGTAGLNPPPAPINSTSSSDSPYQILTSTPNIYYIALHTLLNGFEVKVTSLDSATGVKLDQYTVSSDSGIASPEHVIFAGHASSASTILVWTDEARQVVNVNVVGSKHTSSFDVKDTGEKVDFISVHAAQGVQAPPHFLVHYQTASSNWAEVYHIDLTTSTASKAYDLPKFSGRGAVAASTVDAYVYFTLNTMDEAVLISSTSQKVLGRWPVNGFNALGLTNERPYPLHAATEVVARSGSTFAVRTAVLLSNGDWVMIRNGETSWMRAESLSGIVKAQWAVLRKTDSLLHDLEKEENMSSPSAFTYRLNRHMHDLKLLPTVIRNLWQFFLAKLFAPARQEKKDASKDAAFGFNKLIVAATDNGRVIALDACNSGRVLWNVDARACKTEQDPAARHKWNASSFGSIFERLTCISSQGGLQDSPSTLRNITGTGNSMLDIIEVKPLGAVREIDQTQVLSEMRYGLSAGQLEGYNQGKQLWQFVPKLGYHIVSVTPRYAFEPIASIGKVLGNRKVLYKYLNPNAAIVVAVNNEQRATSIYVLDSASGNVLYSADHSNVDNSRRGASVISENWIAYSFSTDAVNDTASKGYQLVMAEMYESDIPNDRGPLGIISNYSTTGPLAGYQAITPHVVSQIFHVAEEISSMAVTQTAQGITSRQLLVGLAGSNSIVSIPQQVLDPRRTVGKDPTSAQQTEESLSRYSPMIEFDPKWYLNHKQEVLGVEKIITTPATLESTSLVFAYGLDFFGTRVTPSFAFDVLGNSFNKIQLLSTVAALTLGVFFVAPLIQRKQTHSLWQNS